MFARPLRAARMTKPRGRPSPGLGLSARSATASLAAAVRATATASASVSAYLTNPAVGADPYEWYPALDLNTIPFHTAAGAWGAQQAIVAPEAPREPLTPATASSLAQLQAAISTPNTRVTVTQSFAGGAMLVATIRDVEIIIPPEYEITGSLTIGQSGVSTIERVRVRGNTVGQFSGGTIRALRFSGLSATDIIVDGIGMTGVWGNGSNNFALRLLDTGATSIMERLAVVNCRIHTGGAAFDNKATHAVFAGNSVFSGDFFPRASPDVGWCFRSGSGTTPGTGTPLVFFQNDLRNTRYHNLRFHRQPASGGVIYIAENTLVDEWEARILDTFPVDGNTGQYAAIWALDNGIWGAQQPGFGGGPHFSSQIADYVRYNNNIFHGLPSSISITGATNSDQTGNTFNASMAAPGWGEPNRGCGDPTSLSVL